MLSIVALSGCLGIFDDDDALTNDNENGDQEGSLEQSGQEEEPEPLPARLNGTVLIDGNETAADLNLTLKFVEEDGAADGNESDGPSEFTTTTDDEGQYVFEDLRAGSYRFLVNATCCAAFNETVELAEGENKTLDVGLESLQLEPAPEGGEASGGATGASLVLSSRASFTLENGDHAQIELIPESDDPLAQQGESYTLRLYLPDGEEEDYSAGNGEPIVTESVMEGEYEITIWPVAAGDINYTIEWCAFTSTHCVDA